MTTQTRATLKGNFEDGDVPSGSNYTDLIDSFVSLSDTTAQTIASDLVVNGDITFTTVSASAVLFKGDVTAQHVYASALTIRASAEVCGPMAIQGDLIVKASAEVCGNTTMYGDLEVKGTLSFAQTQFGEAYVTASQGVSASATYVPMLSTVTAQSAFLNNFEVTAGSLKYTGTNTSQFLGLANVSLRASANNTLTFVTFAIDGSAITRMEIEKEVGTTEDEIEEHGMLQLRPNERVELMLKGDQAAARGWVVDKIVFTVKE